MRGFLFGRFNKYFHTLALHKPDSMGFIDIIVENSKGKSDRELLHEILANQYNLEHSLNLKFLKIMSALDDLKTSVASEDTAIQGLVTAFNNLNTQVQGAATVEDLQALKADADAQTAAINAALNPPAPAPATT